MSFDRSQCWYLQKSPKETATKLFQALSCLEEDNKSIANKDKEYLSMYMNRWVGVEPGDYKLDNVWKIHGEIYEPVVYNVVRSAADTLINKILLSPVRAFVSVNGGDWKLHNQARNLQKFVDGIVREKCIREEMKKAFLECAILGTSFVKYWVEDDEIKVEWQPKNEFFVDHQACATSEPTELFQVKYVNAETFASKFNKKEIKNHIYNSIESLPGGESLKITNMVKVVEAWKKSSGPGKKDGRHVISVKDMILLDEPMGYNFPLVKLDWSSPPRGWFGQGLIELCYGMQKELTENLQKIQRALFYHCNPSVIIPEGVPEDAVSNMEGVIYRGRGIEVQMPQVIPPALIEYCLLWEQKIYDSQGVSSMEAQARIPAQEVSGKALRTFKAMSDIRNIEKDEMRSEAFLRLINGIIKTISESGRNVQVNYQDKVGKMNKIKWNDAKMLPDAYTVQLFPTSILPTEPAGKIQQVQELMQIGMISPDMAMDLIDLPDLEQASEVRLAGYRHAQWIVEQILYEGEEMMPNELMDLPTVISWARSSYLYATQHNADRDRLDALEIFISSCMALVEKMEQEQMQKELQQQMMMQQAQMAVAPQQEAPPPEQ